MKITFVPIDHIVKNSLSLSTIKRVYNAIQYMPNTYVQSGDAFLETCDVIIYQDRFEGHDKLTSKRFKNKGRKIVLDVSYPIWDPYKKIKGTKVNNFYEMIKYADIIILSNENLLASFKKRTKPMNLSFKVYVLSTPHTPQECSKYALNYMKILGGKANVLPLEKTGNGIRIGFIPHVSIDSTNIAAGTRIRVLNPVEHIKNYVISYDFEELKYCDVVIFQARWQATDLILAKKLYELGIPLGFDTTDPHWDTVNFDTSLKRKHKLEKLLRYISFLTFPTEELKRSFLKWRKDKRLEIIPDCIDLQKHSEIVHHTKKDKYTICWFGCRSNIGQVDEAREDLERLGKEFNLKFIAVYDTGIDKREVEPLNNMEFEIRDWSDDVTIKTILESDVTINPRYDDWRKYKSRNKSIKSLALGVPCVERNFYKEIKKLLSSSRLRNKLGAEGIELAKNYDSKLIAKQMVDLYDNIINKSKIKKNKIAVVTSITCNFDNLHEPEYYDENVDYYAFMDEPTKSLTWNIIPIKYTHFKQPRLSAKVYKILIHKFFPDYKWLIWVDGSLVLRDSMEELIDKFMLNADIALFKHRFRNCPYDEYLASFRNTYHAIGEPRSIREDQSKKYEQEGLPRDCGLYECTFIVRRNTKKVAQFNEAWMSEIIIASSSDQVPFRYTLWKHSNIRVNTIEPGDCHDSRWAYYIEHKRG